MCKIHQLSKISNLSVWTVWNAPALFPFSPLKIFEFSLSLLLQFEKCQKKVLQRLDFCLPLFLCKMSKLKFTKKFVFRSTPNPFEICCHSGLTLPLLDKVLNRCIFVSLGGFQTLLSNNFLIIFSKCLYSSGLRKDSCILHPTSYILLLCLPILVIPYLYLYVLPNSRFTGSPSLLKY